MFTLQLCGAEHFISNEIMQSSSQKTSALHIYQTLMVPTPEIFLTFINNIYKSAILISYNIM